MEISPLVTIDLDSPLACQDADDVVPLGPTRALAADLAAHRGIRCSALADLLPGPAVLVDDAAVFVHTGVWVNNPRGQVMPRCAPLPGKSTRWTSDRRLLRSEDVIRWDEGAVTTPARTCADLLFADPSPLSIGGILALLRQGLEESEVKGILGRTFRGRDSARAIELLDQIGGAELPVIR